MLRVPGSRLLASLAGLAARATRALWNACRPTGVAGGFIADLTRSRAELVTENALLRQQLIVASRAVKRPAFRVHERGLLVLLASLHRQWRHALLLVTPETLLRWHREGFRLFWRRRSRSVGPREPRLAPNVVALIHRMATENRLWGAERIRGEPRSPVRSRPPPCSEDCTMTTAPQRESSGRPKEPTQPREATALWQRGPRSD